MRPAARAGGVKVFLNLHPPRGPGPGKTNIKFFIWLAAKAARAFCARPIEPPDRHLNARLYTRPRGRGAALASGKRTKRQWRGEDPNRRTSGARGR